MDKVIKRIEQVKLMERRDDWSQRRQIDHVATDMDELIRAHPPSTAARLWQEFVRNEAFMKAERKRRSYGAKCVPQSRKLERRRYTSGYVHGDEFTVELRTDGFQDAKAMSEHDVDINASNIIGTGQNTKTKVVTQVSSWRPAGITLVRLEQSRAAELATNTDATTKDNEKHNG